MATGRLRPTTLRVQQDASPNIFTPEGEGVGRGCGGQVVRRDKISLTSLDLLGDDNVEDTVRFLQLPLSLVQGLYRKIHVRVVRFWVESASHWQELLLFGGGATSR